MHLLATTSGLVDGSPEAIDLNQSPADLIVLSAADSELAALARAHDATPCPLRLANLLQLQHNLSVDLYVEKTLAHARLIVLRLLGGASYWPYGLDQIEAHARANGIALAVLPGDAQPDPELGRRSTLAPHHVERLRQYLVMGGQHNAAGFLAYCRHLLGEGEAPVPASPLAKPDSTAIPPSTDSRSPPSPSTVPSSKAHRRPRSMRWSTPSANAASAARRFTSRASRTNPART